jgi:hypothetical protein
MIVETRETQNCGEDNAGTWSATSTFYILTPSVAFLGNSAPDK